MVLSGLTALPTVSRPAELMEKSQLNSLECWGTGLGRGLTAVRDTCILCQVPGFKAQRVSVLLQSGFLLTYTPGDKSRLKSSNSCHPCGRPRLLVLAWSCPDGVCLGRWKVLKY